MVERATSCDLCEAALASAVGVAGLEALPIVRCAHCGLVITSPRPTEATLGEWYPDDYYAHVPREPGGLWRFAGRVKAYKGRYPSDDGPFRRTAYRALTAALSPFILGHLPYMGPGRRLLDVGCGTGAALQWAREHGWVCRGVEMDAAAVEIARSSGLDVIRGSLETAGFEPASFDAISLTQVLEHAFSPTRTLRQCRTLLRAGGIVVVAVPNFDSHFRCVMNDWWPSLELPRHLYHFTDRTLPRLARKCGFDVREIRFRSPAITTLGNLASLRRYLREARRSDGSFRRAEVLVQMGQRIPGALRDCQLRLSDSMLAVLAAA